MSFPGVVLFAVFLINSEWCFWFFLYLGALAGYQKGIPMLLQECQYRVLAEDELLTGLAYFWGAIDLMVEGGFFPKDPFNRVLSAGH